MAQIVIITAVEKEGTKVTLTVNERKFPITYDMTTHIMHSYTNRSVIKFPSSAICSDSLSQVDKLIVKALMCATNQQCETLEKLEKYLVYPELLANVSRPQNLPRDCPRGFIKWLQDNEKPLTDNSLIEFEIFKARQQLTKEDNEVINVLTTGDDCPYSPTCSFIVNYYIKMSAEKRKKFNQILKTSLKNVSWNLSRDIQHFEEFAIRRRRNWDGDICPENWEDYVDTNRTFGYNHKLLQEVSKRERNKALIATEDLIRPITELSNEQFVIVVPETAQDFTDEGNMQNNCVGSYYHSSIRSGDNFIYFIRKADNPKHSYITNRFNRNEQKTVETRKVNNRCNDDTDAQELIREIDKKIRELLGMTTRQRDTDYRYIFG